MRERRESSTDFFYLLEKNEIAEVVMLQYTVN